MPKTKNKWKGRLNARCSEHMAEAVADIAEKKGLKPSDYLRIIVAEAVRNEEAQDERRRK